MREAEREINVEGDYGLNGGVLESADCDGLPAGFTPVPDHNQMLSLRLRLG